MISRLVIATHNQKKASEMLTILGKRFPNIEILTLANFSDAPEPEETGQTYSENALIKAMSAFKYSGEWCVADDAGLEIDALDGAPGLYSKRFGGEELSFPDKMAKILTMLEGNSDRQARFRCNVCLIGPNHEAVSFEATCEGVIATELSGTGGFGYDPIFFLPELGCCMADLTANQKHEISHRGKVLTQLGDYLASI